MDNRAASGLKVHSVLASTSGGVPLGVLHQQVWCRDPAELGKKQQRHKKPIEDKQSQRWLSALDVTQNLIAQEIIVVTVADREAEIYELFVLPRRPNCEFLICAHHNRIANSSADQPEMERLQQLIGLTPPCGQITLELRRH